VNYIHQRRFARYRTDIPLHVTVLQQDGHVCLHGRCCDISEAGLSAIISEELVKGEMVKLDLSLPNQAQLPGIEAIVRNRRRLRHGFEFIHLLPIHHESILPKSSGATVSSEIEVLLINPSCRYRLPPRTTAAWSGDPIRQHGAQGQVLAITAYMGARGLPNRSSRGPLRNCTISFVPQCDHGIEFCGSPSGHVTCC